MLSRTAQYALRAMLSIAEETSDRATGVDDLASRLDLPRNYLSKTLHQLVRGGVLVSTRGRNGGFRLSRASTEITLLDVVSTFGELSGTRRCLLGRVACSDQHSCVAHTRWRETSERITIFFRETSLADLLSADAGKALTSR